LLADVLLVVHFLIAAFILGGLLLVWLGAALGWRWVRNPWFRYLHVAAIAFVAAEAVLGIACPLTVSRTSCAAACGRNPSSGGGYIACSITARRNGSSPPPTSCGRSLRF
jgi:hypothetical protein